VALVLYGTSPSLLSGEIVDLPNFPEELRAPFLERLEMAGWSWRQTWGAFEELGEETAMARGFQMRHVRRARRLVEALARHRDHADEILALVHRRYRGKDRSLMEWLESWIVEVAGAMRLERAIPELVERLHDADWGIKDSAQFALQWIGGDGVVTEIRRHWAGASGDFRRGAAEAMGHIHTDLSVETCLEFLAEEGHEDTRSFLANALLDNFAVDAIEPIRRMVPGASANLTPDETDLRHHLLAAATIMQVDFPEYERWYAEAVADRWGWPDRPVSRIRKNFREDPDDDEPPWYDEQMAWGDAEDVDDLGDDAPFPDDPAPLLPFRREQKKVGRNDPCPCGSGKKYKKCCLRKSAEP
jgi:hypothetical protein